MTSDLCNLVFRFGVLLFKVNEYVDFYENRTYKIHT